MYSHAAPGFSHATRDGGKDSASFYGEAPKGGGTIFRDVAGAVKGAVRDTLDEVEGLFKVTRPNPRRASFAVCLALPCFGRVRNAVEACFFLSCGVFFLELRHLSS